MVDELTFPVHRPIQVALAPGKAQIHVLQAQAPKDSHTDFEALPEEQVRTRTEGTVDRAFRFVEPLLRSAVEARDTQALWDIWSKTLEHALIDSVDSGTIEAAGGAQAFRGRGRVNAKMRRLRPPNALR